MRTSPLRTLLHRERAAENVRRHQRRVGELASVGVQCLASAALGSWPGEARWIRDLLAWIGLISTDGGHDDG